jgi:hypothetical protein
MDASEIIKSLITIGTTVHDAFTRSQASGHHSLKSFLGNLDLKKIEPQVVELMKELSAENSAGAIAEIDAKQTALLKGRKMNQLSVPELIQYSALSRARLLLTTKRLQDAMHPDFLEWLVGDALPVLGQLAPVVLPLLL